MSTHHNSSNGEECGECKRTPYNTLGSNNNKIPKLMVPENIKNKSEQLRPKRSFMTNGISKGFLQPRDVHAESLIKSSFKNENKSRNIDLEINEKDTRKHQKLDIEDQIRKRSDKDDSNKEIVDRSEGAPNLNETERSTYKKAPNSGSLEVQHAPFPGLLNQGATCYMNSFLQALFHIPIFRLIIFSLPSDLISSHPELYGLYSLFRKMQESTTAVSTHVLTHYFGWVSDQVKRQNDAQEFSRILIDRLNEICKESKQENAIPSLFRGKTRSFIRGDGVDIKKDEEFYDISLDVRQNSLELAIADYTNVEILNGENKYDAGNGRMIDAEIGTEIIKLPQIIQFHLQRIYYDQEEQQLALITSKMSYPINLQLDKYIYVLYGVVIHSGSANGGHYHTFLRPNMDRWYKFNDSRVREASEEEVLREGEGGIFSSQSAHLLYYVRKDKIKRIFVPIDSKIIKDVKPPSKIGSNRALQRFGLEDQNTPKSKSKPKSDIEPKPTEEPISKTSLRDDSIVEFTLYTEEALRRGAALGVAKVTFSNDLLHIKIKANTEMNAETLAAIAAGELGYPRTRLWQEENGSLTFIPSNTSVSGLASTLFVQELEEGECYDIPPKYIGLFVKIFSKASVHPLSYIGMMYIDYDGDISQTFYTLRKGLGLKKDEKVTAYIESPGTSGGIEKLYGSTHASFLRNGNCIVLEISSEVDHRIVNEGLSFPADSYPSYADIMINYIPEVSDYYRLRNNLVDIDVVFLNLGEDRPQRMRIPHKIEPKELSMYFALLYGIDIGDDEVISVFEKSSNHSIPKQTPLLRSREVENALESANGRPKFFLHLNPRYSENRRLLMVHLMDGNKLISKVGIRITSTYFSDLFKELHCMGIKPGALAMILEDSVRFYEQSTMSFSSSTLYMVSEQKMIPYPLALQEVSYSDTGSGGPRLVKDVFLVERPKSNRYADLRKVISKMFNVPELTVAINDIIKYPKRPKLDEEIILIADKLLYFYFLK